MADALAEGGALIRLFQQFLIYGLGDAATLLASVLLLPIFTRYLTPADYGLLAMLLIVDIAIRLVCRWGLDVAFLRMYVDCATTEERQRLASSIFFLVLAINVVLLVAGVLSSNWLAEHLLGGSEHHMLLVVTMVGAFVASFFFIPFQVFRLNEQATLYVAVTGARSLGTIAARVVLVIGAGMGVTGIVLADVAVTLVTAVFLGWRFAPLIRPAAVSRQILQQGLVLGLPHVPRAISHQIVGMADRYFLKLYGSFTEVGLYAVGASFGLVLSFVLLAFNTAWQPFFLSRMRDPDAKQTYGVVSTYIALCLVLLVAGVSALADEAVQVFTTPAFHAASRVTPWIALAILFHGVYLVVSIGLIITKRMTAYPIIAGAVAITAIAANLVLVPRFGMLGAAWAGVIAQVVSVAAAGIFAWRAYPIPYEWSRLARIALAGVAGYVAGVYLVPAFGSPLIGLIVRGLVVVAVYGAVLMLTRFFQPHEWRRLQSIIRR